jgi:tetratricopeptide (TPR) repeat protein
MLCDLEGDAMTLHPDPTVLEGFLRSSLPAGETRAVLVHLLRGCAQCRQAMAPVAAAMLEPPRKEEPALTPEMDAAYDAAIAAAYAAVLGPARPEPPSVAELDLRVEQLLSGAPPPPEQEFWTAPLCLRLLERSRAQRHGEPQSMLELAKLARMAADRLDPQELGRAETVDLRSRAWAEMANAYRVNDDLPQAEAALAWAMELHSEGTSSPLLLARLADLASSLLCDQRHFAAAIRMLDHAHDLYRQEGETHEAGRVLLMKGLYTGYAGDPEQGLRLLVQGLDTIDRPRDQRLVFQTLHNILLFRVETGDLRRATRQIDLMGPLYDKYGGPLELIKLRGIEGKIAAGLGDYERAAELFTGVRRDLDAFGLGYQAALISLDLAAVYLRLGRKADVRALIQEMVATFRSVGVEREANAALLMLSDAAERDQTTLELLSLVSAVLQRLQRGPGLLVRPDPD